MITVACPYCDGEGEVLTWTISVLSPCPPTTPCRVCDGTGRMAEDTAETMITSYPTIRDYMEARAESEAEERWERRGDR